MKKSLFKKSLLGLILAIVLGPISGLAQEREVMDLLPPTNLSGVVTDENDVTLTWGAPDYGDPLWVHWDDGENFDSWGFMLGAAIFDIAAKWDADQIESYDSWEITSMRFFITHSLASLTIKIWEGASATEVYSQSVSDFTANAWTEITFDDPVVIDGSTELWAGLNIDMPVGAAVVGIDEGPAVDEYGNLYRYNGTWYHDFDGNNNIQIYVNPPAGPRETSGLQGYNVYRDDVQINEDLVPSFSYSDDNLFNGTYEYFTTAVYDEGESEASNIISITIDQPIILESDSLALVDLYNHCNGENWDQQELWLEGPLIDWSGVQTTGNRVTNLTMVYNGIEGDIPESFGDLTRLRTMHITGNDIESLPSTFGNLESLQESWMGYTLLSSLPANFGDLDSLDVLSLSDNPDITQLPASFGDLELLRWFGIGRCALTSLPSNFGNLGSLVQCYIDDNEITELPAGFGNLESLGYLILSRNQLTALPESFGNLPALISMAASENMITELPASFGNITTLQSLTMDQNGMTALPDNFGGLSSLQDLRLSLNNLTELPASFSNLPSLHFCYLDQNMLTVLPEDFGNISSLWDLSLSMNNLTYLPESMGDLDSLLQLFVVDNQLGSLPESTGDIENLWVLGAGKNAIKFLPENIGNLSKLGYLDVTENIISELPVSIGDLNADTVLLSNNVIREIPESLFDNTFDYLWLDDNILQFGSLEPFDGNVSVQYLYDPQDNFGYDTIIYPESGGNVEFTWDVSGEYNVYQWFKEGVLLNGQTTNTLTLTDITSDDEGVYTLQVTNTLITDLMIESHDVILDAIVTDLEEISLEDITLYPNPVSGDMLNIKSNLGEELNVQIISSNGMKVREFNIAGSHQQINISDLPKGLYFVRITSEGKKDLTTKLIKN